STYVRARLDNLKRDIGEGPTTMPTQFAIIGRLGGYGEGAGRGIRHCNPQIVTDECRVLRLLGVNSLVQEQSLRLADAAKLGDEFRRMYWGRIGGGGGKSLPPNFCPFDAPKNRGNDVDAMLEE